MLRILLYYLLLGAIGALDYVTGYETSLGCFYILFISLVAWNSGRMHGIVFSVLSAATWAFCDHVLGHHYLHAWTLYWNCANRVFTFTVLTLCLTKIRFVLEGQKRLIFDLRRLSLNLSQIYDLFPVCGLCHEFCVDDEVRQQIAQHLRDNLGSPPFGRICPHCMAQRQARIESFKLETGGPAVSA